MTDDIKNEVIEEEEVSEEYEGEEEEDGLENVIFKFDDDEEDEEIEEEDEAPEEEPEEEGTVEEPETKPEERVFTQEEVNKIVGNARIKGRDLEEQVALLEKQTGLKLPEVNEYVRQQAAQNMVDEYGIPEAEAKMIVDNQHKVEYLEKNLAELNYRQQLNQQMFQYQQEKQQHLSNPLVRQYEAEIDAVVQEGWKHGQQIGFEAAVKFVLGGKVLQGEVADNIRSTAQQRTARQKRPMPAPEGVAGGAAVAQSAPRELQALARAFGADPKNVAREYLREQKRRPT